MEVIWVVKGKIIVGLDSYILKSFLILRLYLDLYKSLDLTALFNMHMLQSAKIQSVATSELLYAYILNTVK